MIKTIGHRETFRRLHKSGVSHRVRGMRMLYLTQGLVNEGHVENEVVVGFAARKSLGTAVKRNKLRRRMKEALWEINKTAPIPPGAYLFTPNPSCVDSTYEDLKTDLSELLSQIKCPK